MSAASRFAGLLAPWIRNNPAYSAASMASGLPAGIALRRLDPDVISIAQYMAEYFNSIMLYGDRIFAAPQKPLAIILDIDGTILSAGSPSLTLFGAPSLRCSLLVRDIAIKAQRAGCKIFLVTARPEWIDSVPTNHANVNSAGEISFQRAITMEQLKQCGYYWSHSGESPQGIGQPIWYNELFMLPQRRPDGNFNDFKSHVRRERLSPSYNVVLNVGDQWDDLIDGSGASSQGLSALSTLNSRVETQHHYWSFAAPFDAALLCLKLPAEQVLQQH